MSAWHRKFLTKKSENNKKNITIITNSKQVKAGDQITATLQHGAINCTIDSIRGDFTGG